MTVWISMMVWESVWVHTAMAPMTPAAGMDDDDDYDDDDYDDDDYDDDDDFLDDLI
jgi:hypothetical protein